MAETIDSSDRNSYRSLNFTEKVKYQDRNTSQGSVHQPKTRINKSGRRVAEPGDKWHIEWSSGIRKASGRFRYNRIIVRGTQQQARDLLNIINQVPYRTYAEACAAIDPFIEWRSVKYSITSARHVMFASPIVAQTSAMNTHQLRNREQIIRDYHRIKLLDTMVNLCRELENYECEGNGMGMDTTALRT